MGPVCRALRTFFIIIENAYGFRPHTVTINREAILLLAEDDRDQVELIDDPSAIKVDGVFIGCEYELPDGAIVAYDDQMRELGRFQPDSMEIPPDYESYSEEKLREIKQGRGYSESGDDLDGLRRLL